MGVYLNGKYIETTPTPEEKAHWDKIAEPYLARARAAGDKMRADREELMQMLKAGRLARERPNVRKAFSLFGTAKDHHGNRLGFGSYFVLISQVEVSGHPLAWMFPERRFSAWKYEPTDEEILEGCGFYRSEVIRSL